MPWIALGVTLGAALLGSASDAAAQEAPDTVIDKPQVSSVIIVGDVVDRTGPAPADQSGLTVDPIIEDAARAIRRDAEDSLTRQQLPNMMPISQPSVTVVSVEQVIVDRPNTPDSEACVTIGKVGARKGCRPPRK